METKIVDFWSKRGRVEPQPRVQRESFYQVGMLVGNVLRRHCRWTDRTSGLVQLDQSRTSPEMGGLACSRPGDLFESHLNFGSKNFNLSIPTLGLLSSAKLLHPQYLNEQLWIFDWKINDKIASSSTDKWFWSRRRPTEINRRRQMVPSLHENRSGHGRP